MKIAINHNAFPFHISKRNLIYFFIIIFFIYLLLSLFRNPYPDERTYYLTETSHMTSVLADGEWFGNDGVGIHGFLFKLPVALIFLITGPSIFIATLFNVIIAVLSCLLFYKILENYFHEDYLKFLVILLFITSYHFVTKTPSYVREIPAIFSMLLFIYLVMNNKNRFVIGLSLLLLLDAKEHVFFQAVPAIILWLIYHHFISDNKDLKFIKNLREYIFSNFLFFSPSLLYLYFMFFTSIIPLNMFNAYILGLITSKNNALYSLSKAGTSATGLHLKYSSNNLFNNLLIPKELLLRPNYFTKFFMPRLLSFISVPKLAVVPAFITSWIYLIKRDDKQKQYNVLFFLLLWSNFVTFYLRDSNGRYLFAVTPILFIYFTNFLNDIDGDLKSIIIIVLTILSIIIGTLFEYHYQSIKIILNAILIISILFVFFNSKLTKFNKKKVLLSFCILYCFITFSVAIASSIIIPSGQINNTLRFGYCANIYKIANELPDNVNIWINDRQEAKLMRFYKMDKMPTAEISWQLQDWEPKKKMLKKYYNPKIFYFGYESSQEFRNKLYKYKVKKVIFQKSLDKKFRYYNQNSIVRKRFREFLKLEKVLNLKNKNIYIFNVI